MTSFTIKDILRLEVAPALGCTDPVAVSLGAAAATSLLGTHEPEKIQVWVDPNIFKNGMAVRIPGTGDLNGLDLAAALGAYGGDASRGLESLDTIEKPIVDRAREFVDQGGVSVDLFKEVGLKVKVKVTSSGQTAEALIKDAHDHIVSLKLNGQVITDSSLLAGGQGPQGSSLSDLEAWLKDLSLQEMIGLLDGLDQEDLDFLNLGIEYNTRLAENGLESGPGLGLGKCLQGLVNEGLLQRDMHTTARVLTAAAADARMGGVKLPAMSSAGSGNHGLTATLPIWAVKDFVECSGTQVLKALALSQVLTAYVKTHTGRLSAICGCSVGAGAGATGGIAYLLGGGISQIAGAINNLIEDLAGIVCDGAKNACALRLSTAAGSAVQSALLSLHGVHVVETEGLVGHHMEDTTENLGVLSVEGMSSADQTMLRILTNKFIPAARS
jgi:L-cysteine desulfidase